MNDEIKIGLPIEYEDDKNIIRTGLWLKEYEVEALEKRLNKCNQLQSNWNSLRELIEQRIYLIEPKGTCINFYCEYDSEDDYVQGMKDQARLNTLKSILDKMNELEGENKQ